MSGERVDLDYLRALAAAAHESARERGENYNAGPGLERWIMAQRGADRAVDVVVESSGFDVFVRALEVDARFVVAAQPAVVLALIARIRQLEFGMRTSASSLEERNDSNAAMIARAMADEGTVLP